MNKFMDWTENENGTLVQRFQDVAQQFPERLAFCDSRDTDSSTRLSYRELNEQANRVARSIVRQIGESNEPVALLLEKKDACIAAVLGALKAGKIAVPLETSYPTERTRLILEDSGARLLLCDEANNEVANRLANENCEVVNIDRLASNDDNAHNLDLAIEANAAAYLIYTSGSTGAPKGVIETHRNVLHHAGSYTKQLHFQPEDRIALLSSPSVGQGMKTVFCALLNGARLCAFDVKSHGANELAQWLLDQKITVWVSVPSVFRHLARESSTRSNFPDLRLIRLGGEALHARDVELFQQRFSENCTLVNSYSSTETGNITLFFVDVNAPIDGDTVPAGYSGADVEMTLRDEQGNAVETGEIGEIVVRSRFLSPGYWRRPELTQQVFQSEDDSDFRLYRTGDLGMMSRDGCLHHRGRKDFQVKIRGFRVEIGEVEAALKAHESVRDVVVARLDARGENYLVAYVVFEEREATMGELRAFLRGKLPAHAVPARFQSLVQLPQTPNGKIDRAQLPRFEDFAKTAQVEAAKIEQNTTQRRSENEMPDDIEHRLAQIWKDVLKVSSVARHDDFFAIGGHSLLAGVLLSRIEEVFARRIPLAALFGCATIGAQAELLRASAAESPSLWPSVVVLQPNGSRPPLFFAHDLSDGFLSYRDFLRCLHADQPIYGFQPDEASSTRSLQKMAASYARDLCGFYPEGAFNLCGFSFAGTLAFEVARQLEARGREVAFLALLDTNCRADPAHGKRTATVRQRQRNHRYIWRRLRPRDRRIYFAHYTQKRLESLRQRFFGQPETPPRSKAEEEIARANDESIKANRAASASYQVRKYGGHLTLFRAMLSLQAERSRDLGWKEFARSIEIVESSGTHDTMLETPHAYLLARRFTRCLQKAQRDQAQRESSTR